MPTATLSFTLPGEELEFAWARNGRKYLSALQDFREALRKQVKYGDEQATTWEEVQSLFFETVSEAGVDLDEDQ